MTVYNYRVVGLKVMLVVLVDHEELGLVVGQHYPVLVTVLLGDGEYIGQVRESIGS